MKEYHEYLVLGAGPAGVQAGYFMQKNKLDYLILERNADACSFFETFPRHRKLISINKVYTGYDNPDLNMRWDWNSLISDDPDMLMKNFSTKYFPDAGTFVEYVSAFTKKFDLAVKYNVSISKIAKDDKGMFVLTTNTGDQYTCKNLIMGTGMSIPYMPEIKGIEKVENYFDVSVDPDDFTNQSVLIIGKGNSAFETADNLIETTKLIHMISPHTINFAWRTHYVGHLRAVNNNFLDTYQLKSQNGLLNASLSGITKEDNGQYKVMVDYTAVTEDEDEALYYDRVISCCGFKFDETIFDESLSPAMIINDRFPDLTCEFESTNTENLYFIGSPTHGRDYKMATSGFIHGFRYNVEALVKILVNKNHALPFPVDTISLTPRDITDIIIKKVNLSSALWQQFAYFGDYVVLDEERNEARYFDALPVDFIHQSMADQDSDYLVVTLEYGKLSSDPFDSNVLRVNRFDIANASDSTFLHPIIRRFNKGKLVDKIELIEDFKGEFDRPNEHIAPLHGYVSNILKNVLV
jgi:thioredoxin reductase